MHPIDPARPSQTAIFFLASIIVFISLVGCLPDTKPDKKHKSDDPTHIDDTSTVNPLSINYRPPSQSDTEIIEVPETGINLGWGWDRSDAEPIRSICVEFVEASEPAQTRYMTMSEVSDSFELMSSMGMSAQASVKTIGFKASGKAQFAKETNITGYSSNFVMNANVENGVKYTAPTEKGYVKLTDAAARLAAKNISEFEHQCGDSFVSAVYSGAKLTAVITIETSSQKEKQKLSAELSGSGWGASFKASMNQTQGSATEGKKMSMSIFQTGGRGDSIPKDKDDLLAKLEILPAIAFDAPKDFHMAITPYESLANWPAQPLIPDSNEFAQLASYWGAYNSLYDEFQTVLDNPDHFTAPMENSNHCIGFIAKDGTTTAIPTDPKPLTTDQISRLEQIQDDVLDSLLRLQNFARFCSVADEDCDFPEDAFRSPIAFRAQLPLEISTTAVAADAESYTLASLTLARIAEPAKRRCQANKKDPLCLNNNEINHWANKLGYQLIKYEKLAERDATLTKLISKDISLSTENCADPNGSSIELFSAEPGFPAIWYQPAIKSCVMDPDAECNRFTPEKGQTTSNDALSGSNT